MDVRAWRAQVKAALCYDRPPTHFAPTPPAAAHELLLRLRDVLRAPVHPNDCVAAMCAADDAAALPANVHEASRSRHSPVSRSTARSHIKAHNERQQALCAPHKHC